ncbi:MAG: galactokinase family protein, partial [Calditrichaeota bacterium]|nr:galactokinase family protein [Calditrichota bacterium]
MISYYGNNASYLADQKSRIVSLLAVFSKAFAKSSVFIVHAPGRTNLIGEHTDYNGYPVMPMA